MKILAVDTALGACSVAVLEGERVLAHRWTPMARGHAEALAPMVEETLKESKTELAEFERLAVTTGPGTFTGQRVGLAFMRGLRLALERPLVGVTTLEAMAEAARVETGARTVAVLHEARRGEVYGALYGPDAVRIPVKIATFEAMLQELAAAIDATADVAIAGTGAAAAAEWLSARGREVRESSVRQPDARFVARLATGRADISDVARPLYLRPPDAKLSALSLRIRRAEARDQDTLAALNRTNLGEAWTARFFASVLDSHNGIGFIAEANGMAVGFVLARMAADEAEILAIGVSAPYRRNGVARRLLQAAAAQAYTAGTEKLFLEVAPDNTAGQKLYESQGFQLAGRRKAYYADGRDALLYVAHLSSDGLGGAPKVD